MAGSASTETAGTVILSAATATPQDVHEAALSRFVATAPKERYGEDLATARQALASLR